MLKNLASNVPISKKLRLQHKVTQAAAGLRLPNAVMCILSYVKPQTHTPAPP